MKRILILAALMTITCLCNAQAKKGPIKKMSYDKHTELSKIELEGYKKTYFRMADTTQKHKDSYVLYKRNTNLSNSFEVELKVDFGESSRFYAFNGDLAAYKKKPMAGIRGPKENVQPNTKDSIWVVKIDDKKVFMNYYYCFFTNEEGEVRAKYAIHAHYDNGVNGLDVSIRPQDHISKESGRTKLKTEQEFKSKLTSVAELEKELNNAMEVFLKSF